ncbi:winged helix-turn-helix transcriptional regulator [Pontibacter cellulosilyticus]|uniref:Helix-turn-helix transcriptional regulator n=1 Tax=Pontibacter cellulosilyticus TaxID=1720253 RepID=A0A923N2W4_9BACT|nr:helix-turn-helix domain-containing protein [Pontibacter cellulosilyticus]MBC5991248.1 helix-turn-helix transcriptional regulator [Pontibacter cellulosilyticus]
MENEKVYITAKCPIRTTLELVGGKWKLLILHQLYNKPLRLSVLKATIPDISEKMLIQELKVLVDSGLVHRENFGEVPPRVEYSLTSKGKLVNPLIKEMVTFARCYTE